MKVLLDTRILLWSLSQPERLTPERIQAIEDPSNTVFVSSISAAEIAIKSSLGKLAFDHDLVAVAEESGFEWLSFTAEEAMVLSRMLIAQSRVNDLTLITDDGKFAPYGCRLM